MMVQYGSRSELCDRIKDKENYIDSMVELAIIAKEKKTTIDEYDSKSL